MARNGTFDTDKLSIDLSFLFCFVSIHRQFVFFLNLTTTICSVSAGSPRRRVLADLPGNKDSPICGLIPSFSRIEISSQSILKSSKTAGISCANPAMAPAGFDPQTAEIAAGIESPIGENLLRSQVQILLNKVESEAPRDNNRSRFKDIAPDLCLNFHSHSISPALRLVAPTPMNTPLGGSSIPAPPPPPAAPSSSSSSLTPRSRSDSSPHGLQDAFHGDVADMEDSKESRRDSGIELFVDLTISPQIMSASRESSRVKNDESEGGESERGSSLMKHTPIRIAESVTSGGNHHHHAVTPLTATHEVSKSNLGF